MVSKRKIEAEAQSFPIVGDFKISRGVKRTADVVCVSISQGDKVGRGECMPYSHYGESQTKVLEEVEKLTADLEAGLTREDLQLALPPGATRNAIDCALWDLEAKLKGQPVWHLAGLPEPKPIATAYTLSLGTPQEMASAARANNHRPLLKLKLGSTDTDLDVARMEAVRSAAPKTALIADANEGWAPEQLKSILSAAKEFSFKMIEQPLPASDDECLQDLTREVPVGADESFHGPEDLAGIAAKYDVVNIKLDKTGGLTGAIETLRQAEAMQLDVMVGCMVATSLSMAPALLLAQSAAFVDLDGPLLLASDRDPGLTFDGSTILPAPADLWGHP